MEYDEIVKYIVMVCVTIALSSFFVALIAALVDSIGDHNKTAEKVAEIAISILVVFSL